LPAIRSIISCASGDGDACCSSLYFGPPFSTSAHELPHRGEDTLGAVGLVDIHEPGAPLIRVGQELEQGRLVRNERADEFGAAGDEVEADRRTAAVAVHVGRFATDLREYLCGVVRVQRHRNVLGLAVERAARVTPLVVAHDGVPVGQPSAEISEHARVGGPTRDAEQNGAGAPDLDIERRPWNLHRPRFHLGCRAGHDDLLPVVLARYTKPSRLSTDQLT
jgi:hypothetical protein